MITKCHHQKKYILETPASKIQYDDVYLGFIPCKVEQQLLRMELQEKEVQID